MMPMTAGNLGGDLESAPEALGMREVGAARGTGARCCQEARAVPKCIAVSVMKPMLESWCSLLYPRKNSRECARAR